MAFQKRCKKIQFMKHIKTYESIYGRTWKIMLKQPEFEIGLNKITNIPKNDRELFMDNFDYFKIKYSNYPFIYFSEVTPKNFVYDKFPLSNNIIEVEVTPEDIEIYNLEKVAKKYNL
jgi:hypothetical protein